LRNGNYGSVLPDYTAVILDEAHLVEEVASEYFGAQVSNYQIDDLVRDLGMLTIEDADVDKELTHSVARMSRFLRQLLDGLSRWTRRRRSLSDHSGTFAKRKSGEKWKRRRWASCTWRSKARLRAHGNHARCDQRKTA
jgi:Rad3-related DNA helicase